MTPAAELFQRFPLNRRGRDFGVGDLHGSFDDLERALESVDFNPLTDRLFGVGDLIDRGPDSDRCLEWLAKPWFHGVRGNHDQMMLDSWYSTAWASDWNRNGNEWVRMLDVDTQARFRATLDALPLAIEVATPGGDVGIVHAGLNGLDWAGLRQELRELESRLRTRPLLFHHAHELLARILWARGEAKSIISQANGDGRGPGDAEGLRALVFGHTAVTRPVHAGNRWLIDTGAGYRSAEASVTLLNLHDLTLHSTVTAAAVEAANKAQVLGESPVAGAQDVD